MLTREQKSIRHLFLSDLENGEGAVFADKETGVTIAAMRPFPNAKSIRVSVAMMSENEPKFSRKMGELVALSHLLEDGQFIALPITDHATPLDVVHSFHQFFAAHLEPVAELEPEYSNRFDGYDADGYDADGYDADGYDADGFDRNGNERNAYIPPRN